MQTLTDTLLDILKPTPPHTMTTYIPLNERILIRRVPADSPTIVMPNSSDHPEDRYYVVAAAPDCVFKHNGAPVVSVDDEILLLPKTGVQILGDQANNIGLVHVSAIAAIIRRTSVPFETLS